MAEMAMMTNGRIQSTHAAPGCRRHRSDEAGSILIMVAIAMLGLLSFSAFAVDNGVMLSSRRQAQNAADAAALAAAQYLAWDDGTDQAGAQAIAVATAQRHQVWGSQPDVTMADVTFPTCPPGAPGLVDTCVRVDVYRNQRANGNPLPAFFANLAGVTDQGVRATATAQVVYGQASDCLLPFAIPDRWLEFREDEAGAPPDEDPANFPLDEIQGMSYLPDGWWDPDDTYDAFYTQGQQGGTPLPGTPGVDVDMYIPGSPVVGGTGYDAYRDYGMQVLLKAGNGSQIAPSWYYPIVLPDGDGGGASAYQNRIVNCTEVDVPEEMNFSVEPGNMVGPTRAGVLNLIAQDPGATWVSGYPGSPNPDGTFGRISGGCMDDGSCARSPRWRAVATFDVENYMSGHRTGRGEVYVTGFVGVFLQNMVGNDVMAYISTFDFDPGPGTFTDDTSSFLRNVILVR